MFTEKKSKNNKKENTEKINVAYIKRDLNTIFGHNHLFSEII